MWFHTVYYYPPTPKRVRLGKFETQAEFEAALAEHAARQTRHTGKYEVKHRKKTKKQQIDDLKNGREFDTKWMPRHWPESTWPKL